MKREMYGRGELDLLKERLGYSAMLSGQAIAFADSGSASY